MKFTCLQQNLKEGLAKVSRAVATRTTLPILSNIYLSAESGSIKLAASNMETTIVTWVGAKVEEEGSITVPAKLFLEFVNTLPGGTINGHSDANILKLETDNAKSSFNGTSADEFPSLPLAQQGVLFNVEPDIFEEAINKVTFAAATDDSRPVLTGVLFNVDKENVSLVGVDGFRLSEVSFKLGNEANSETKFIVPSKTLQGVAKLMGSSKEPIGVALLPQKNQIVFQNNEQIISSRLIDGEFPNYKQIIPSEKNVSMNFTKDDFENAVKLASIFAKDSANIVKMTIDPEKSQVVLSANTAHVRENASRFVADI